MIPIRNADGKVIAQSKNLRGINERCRKVPGAKAIVSTYLDWTDVTVIWPDGSFALAMFASATLAYKYANTKRFQGAAA